MTCQERISLVLWIGALELAALIVRSSLSLPHVLDAALVSAQVVAAFIALGLALSATRERR